MSFEVVVSRFKTSIAQFLRFAIVGVSNTAVDFAVTNGLVLMLKPTSGLGLMLISITACGVATLNSYFFNRRWTFRDTAGERIPGALAKFVGVALLSMAVNTSVFLFVAKYLPDRVPMSPLLAINLAKLGGVGAAFAVSFLGYRFGVFQTDAIKQFRSSFCFRLNASNSFLFQIGSLTGLSLLIRGGYLLLTTAVYGDAVSYGWVADSIAGGDFTHVDTFWSSLFCFWEALLRLAGFGLIPAAILASLIPGVLLIIPVTWLALLLYGPAVAWLAGALCAFHPRLIEYSCNGYPETFYLLLFATGIALATRVVQGAGARAAFGWGVAFGLVVAVRSEALFAFLLSVLVVLVVRGVSRPPTEPGAEYSPGSFSRKRTLSILAVTVLSGFLVATGSYALLSNITLGTPGLFQKTSNLAKQFSEQLDLREAAKETYGREGTLFGAEKSAPSFREELDVLIRRLPRNVFYSLERLPGVLLSPIPLFALLLPVFVAHRGRRWGDETPLLLMLLFPLMFYPLIQVEPRLLFPILAPVHVFGAAGLVAFAAYAESRASIRGLLALFVGAILVFTFAISVWRGFDVERQYAFNRELARWLQSHVQPEDLIAGCGYGYGSTTGFLAEHRTASRIWTESPVELAEFARDKGVKWLLIYEKFLVVANPELLPILDTGIPGLERVYEVADSRGNRTQVYKVSSH